MTQTRSLDHSADPFGVQTFAHNNNDGSVTFERWQDVEPIIENNKRLKGQAQKSDWGRHVGTIPCVILEKWLMDEHNRGNVDLTLASKEMDKIIWKKLNDPDWAWLRVDK